MDLTDRDKKMLIVLGVVAGIAVLFFLFKTITGGGGEEPVAADTTTTTTTTTPTDGTSSGETPPGGTASATPTPGVEAVPPAAEGPVLSGRDFFSPIPPEPTTSVAVSPGASPSASPSGKPKTVDDTDVIDGNTVKLVDVTEKKKGDEVDVDVNGKTYSGNGVGDTFATYYTVNGISVDDGCADFQFDKKGSGQSFKLCL